MYIQRRQTLINAVRLLARDESAVFLYTYLWSIEFNVQIQFGRNGRRKGGGFSLYLPMVYRVQCPNSIWTEWTEKGITGMACRRMDDEEEGMRGKWGFTSKKCEKSPKYAIK